MSDNLHTIFSGSECPPHSVLLAYFRRSLPEEEMHLVERHLVDCAMCSDEVEGLSKMNNPGELDLIVEELDEKIGRKRGRILGMNRNYSLMATAAMILLIIGSVIFVRLLTQTKDQGLISLQTEMATKLPESATESLPSPSGAPAATRSPAPKKATKNDRATSPTGIEMTVADESPEPLAIAGLLSADSDETGAYAMEKKEAPMSSVIALPVSDSVTLDAVVTEYQAPNASRTDSKKAAVEEIAVSGLLDSKGMSIMEIAMQEFSQGNYSRAAVFFERVTANQPGNFKAVYHLAYSYFMEKHYKQASRTLAPILKDPGNDFYKEAAALSEKIKTEKNR